MKKDVFRGNVIEEREDGVWVYEDTKEPVSDGWQERPCGVCGKDFTEEGHDPCLGTLPGVMNACCGHGSPSEAYVQFSDGNWFGGEKALQLISKIKEVK